YQVALREDADDIAVVEDHHGSDMGVVHETCACGDGVGGVGRDHGPAHDVLHRRCLGGRVRHVSILPADGYPGYGEKRVAIKDQCPEVASSNFIRLGAALASAWPSQARSVW